ncbi:integrase core domain-containing protein [Marinobacter sp. 2_MG-2023]|uniref:integrase core domain-containing protein n=1 Tax=Marinobacter sp. 2_MG-2023 TaxID=3062679 RepID=UPI0034C5C7AF
MNVRFATEYQNEHQFRDLIYATEVIGNWRRDYHESRPLSALTFQTPPEFAVGFRTTRKGAKLTGIAMQ